jgi:hypothetical protein
MIVYTVSDGVVSTHQIILKEPLDVENLWTNYVKPHYIRKSRAGEEMAHAEIMNMHGCQRVRRYMFSYDLSDESKRMFEDIMSRKNDNMSLLVVLSPSTRCSLVNTVTGLIVSPEDMSSTSTEGSYGDGRFTRDFGFVFRTFQDETQTETIMDPVDQGGRTIAAQLIQDYLRPHLYAARSDPRVLANTTYELTYHTQCGGYRRYFLHYDDTLSERDLDDIIRIPVHPGYRVTFVPRTRVTEALLPRRGVTYPILVDAGHQTLSSFGRR